MKKQENLGLPMFWLQSEVAPYKVQGRVPPALKHEMFSMRKRSTSALVFGGRELLQSTRNQTEVT